MKLPTLLLTASLAALCSVQEVETPTSPPQEAFSLEVLVASAREHDAAWVEFLDRPSLNCGVYQLAAGAVDKQTPHELDELYYVVSGKARLHAGDEDFAAESGSIFFVERKIEHRFVDIEEDLVVLVLFPKASKPRSEEAPGSQQR
jgi:quercetin dioxygenase-like cupin family protein